MKLLLNIIGALWGLGGTIELFRLLIIDRIYCFDLNGITGIFWCPEVALRGRFGFYLIKAMAWPITLLHSLGISTSTLLAAFISVLIISVAALPLFVLYKNIKRKNLYGTVSIILCSALCSIGIMQTVGGLDYVFQFGLHYLILILLTYCIILFVIENKAEYSAIKSYFIVVLLLCLSVLLFFIVIIIFKSEWYNRIIAEILMAVASVVLYLAIRKRRRVAIVEK